MSHLNEQRAVLFYGTETGNTEEVAREIEKRWDITKLEVINAGEMTIEDFERFDIIVIGLPTWYDGELQSDFGEFYDEFVTIDFTGKIVALFGLGDQVGYPDYFVDSLGILGSVIIENGGKIIGMWPRQGYEFDESKALFNHDLFYGLPIDVENQAELTDSRITDWLRQISRELEEIFVN